MSTLCNVHKPAAQKPNFLPKTNWQEVFYVIPEKVFDKTAICTMTRL